MFETSWIADLDAAGACEAIAGTQVDLREAQWRELVLAAHWADLHSEETVPDSLPVPESVLAGMERAVPLGGDGTPLVAEFACAELAVLMGTGCGSAANLMTDALDLRHRHPALWTALGEGRGQVWKSRKVAHLTHAAGLSREQAKTVDAAVAPYVDALPFPAFVRLVEAKVIEADPTAAEERRVAEALSRFVSTGQSDEHGLKALIVKANAGDVIFFVAMCDRIAQCLAADGDTDPVDVRRSKAVGILAQPALALVLLQKHAGGGVTIDPVDVDRLRPHATLYVRMTAESLAAGTGVAASTVGAVTVQQVTDLLGHCRVTIRPVLDLREQLPVDAYEVPAKMREALTLTRPSSVFPYSHTTGEPDLDHTIAYVPPDRGGPPGQTRVGNLGPLTRFTHRVKTHGRGWRHHQPVPGVYLWRTPHGSWFRVDRHGTHPIPPQTAATLESPSPFERAFARLILAA